MEDEELEDICFWELTRWVVCMDGWCFLAPSSFFTAFEASKVLFLFLFVFCNSPSTKDGVCCLVFAGSQQRRRYP
jgi:hypothetical protein